MANSTPLPLRPVCTVGDATLATQICEDRVNYGFFYTNPSAFVTVATVYYSDNETLAINGGAFSFASMPVVNALLAIVTARKQ